MTFYESIFLRQFSMKLLGLPTTKHFFSFILGCPQDFNFARPFRPFSPVSTKPYQNGRAKLKSCGHHRIKLKKCFVVGRPKSFIENCRKKSIHKTSSICTHIALFFPFPTHCSLKLNNHSKKGASKIGPPCSDFLMTKASLKKLAKWLKNCFSKALELL